MCIVTHEPKWIKEENEKLSEMLAENSQIREQFVCDNDMKAEWCLNKIRRIRAEQKRESEELERQMQFYMDQKDMIDHKADEEVAFFEEILHGYFNSRVDDGFTKATKTKVTYKLPTGNLVLKHRDPEYDYKTEQKKIIEFCENNGLELFVKTEKKLSWIDLKTLTKVDGTNVVLKETGEIVPGIKVTEREDEFEVEVK